ncbi:hypothetical protein GY45DRAFT_1329250 [Cubamyces sp. BRFM 1775]|nr:hypothetical protein GY45DRAFT_1329250 [Cubamyces sp. BRFM 1775]
MASDSTGTAESPTSTPDQCSSECMALVAQQVGCGSVANISCVCNTGSAGPNFFSKAMACVGATCSDQTSIVVSYYYGDLCAGGVPPPPQSESSTTTSAPETFTHITTTTTPPETSLSTRTSTITASTGSTLNSESHTLDSSSHTPESTFTPPSSTPPGSGIISTSGSTATSIPLGIVSTARGPNGATPGVFSSSSSTASSIPEPTLLSSHPRSMIALIVSLPVVISLVLLAMAGIFLRNRIKRRMSVHRARVRATGAHQQTSWVGYDDDDLGSFHHGRSRSAVSATQHVTPRGSFRFDFHEEENPAMKEAHGAEATISPPLASSGQAPLAIPTVSIEPLKSSMDAHSDELLTCQCRAGAHAHHNQETERGAGIENDTNVQLQDRDIMAALQPASQPINTEQRYGSHAQPGPASEAATSIPPYPSSEGQIEGDTEPRMLRLVLPWAFGQHLLSLAAANPPPEGVAPDTVDDEATEPPPAYHLLSRRGSLG